MLQDIITLVIEMTVNVRTGLPLTRTAAASALKQAGFSVKLGTSSKAQALKAVDLLQKRLGPQAIARRMMRLKAECLHRHRDEIVLLITKKCGGIIEDESVVVEGGPGAQADDELEERDQQDFNKNEENSAERTTAYKTSVEESSPGEKRANEAQDTESNSPSEETPSVNSPSPDSCLANSTTHPDYASTHRRSRRRLYSVTFLSPASCYRELDVKLHSLGGNLFLISANCCAATQVDRACHTRQQSSPDHSSNPEFFPAIPDAGAEKPSEDRTRKEGKENVVSGEEREDGEGQNSDTASNSKGPRKGRKKGRRQRVCIDRSVREEIDEENVLTAGQERRLSSRDLPSGRPSGRRHSKEKRSGVVKDKGDGEVDSFQLQGPHGDGSFEEIAMAWLRRGTEGEDRSLPCDIAEDSNARERGITAGGKRSQFPCNPTKLRSDGEHPRAEERLRNPVAEQRVSDSDTEHGDSGSSYKREMDDGNQRDKDATVHNRKQRRSRVSSTSEGIGKRKDREREKCAGLDSDAPDGQRDANGGLSPDSSRAEGKIEVSSHRQDGYAREDTGSRETGGSQPGMLREAESPVGDTAFPMQGSTAALSAGSGQKKCGHLCRTCCTLLASPALYRQHCKSSLHAFNLKRKVKGLPPLTEAQLKEDEVDQHLVCL